MNSFCEVALNLSWESDTLTYSILSFPEAKIGCRVEVNLRNEKASGVITELHNSEPNFKVLPVTKLIDLEPVITQDQLNLAHWMKEQYLCTLGEALFKMVPKGRRKKDFKKIGLGVFPEKIHPLNPSQSKICKAILDSKSQTHLIFGITGSGKTEIYLSLIFETLKNPKAGVIYLIPEVGLTFSIVKRLLEIFPEEVAVIHSYLGIKERFQSYLDILSHKKRIVVGTRSAIFAPLESLDLVIIDEEHDGSYKEFSNPRYHARQIAFKRLQKNSGKLVLGSATPSIEIYHQAKEGKIELYELKERAVAGSKLPLITLSEKKEKESLISGDLQFRIKQRLDKKEQIILFLNRRGYSPFLFSKEKNEFIPCPNCSTSLCFHKNGKALCHLCGYKSSLDLLKNLFGTDIEFLGSGTQKIEESLLSLFPQAKVERLDQDSTQNKEVISDVLLKLEDGQIDILTGTQMIAKGLDLPKVTLVGIINADLGLGMPDFRAAERVYALLSQVAGRAGRRSTAGEVFLQSRDISHPVIKLAVDQNYEQFYEYEIPFRKSLFYPPFSRLVRLVFRSTIEELASQFSIRIAELLKTSMNPSKVQILGPSPCPFAKIDKNFRFHILLKSHSILELRDLIKPQVPQFKKEPKCFVEIDFDPLDLV